MTRNSRTTKNQDALKIPRREAKVRPMVRGETPLRVLTTDLWYTVVYARPRDQRELTYLREQVWMAPLLRSGFSRARARQEVRRMDAWGIVHEARGHTPSIPEQATWLGRSTGVRISGPEVAETLDATIAKSPIRLAPGVERVLRRLRDRGVRLGLVSNLLHETGAGARRLLDSFGILENYSVLVFSDEHPWSKPRPEPFRYALSQLGAAPKEAAHVGDLSYDVIGSRRAGMGSILYTGLHRWEPTHLKDLARVTDPSVVRAGRWTDVERRVLRGL